MKSVLLAIATTLTAFVLPAHADLPCYLDYPGQTIDLGGLCGEGRPVSNSLRFRATLPQVEQATIVGDISQGRTLVGEIYNPHNRTSDGVTLYYAVQTNRELKQGTLVLSSLAPHEHKRIEIILPDLRGMVETYEFEILE